MDDHQPNILLFESLLTILKNQGFSIGVDTHLRIRGLLEERESLGEAQDLPNLKIQLATLLTRNQEEQARFFRLFDAYVDTYSYDPEIKNITRELPWWRKPRFLKIFLSLIAVTIIFSIAWILLRGPKAEIAFSQQSGTLNLWVEDVSTTFSFFPTSKTSIGSRDWKLIQVQPDSQEINLPDPNSSLFSYLLPRPGKYILYLWVKSPQGLDSTQQLINILPAVDLKIHSEENGFDWEFWVEKTYLIKDSSALDSDSTNMFGTAVFEALSGTWNPSFEEEISWNFTHPKEEALIDSGDSVSVSLLRKGDWEVQLFYKSTLKGEGSYVFLDTLSMTARVDSQQSLDYLKPVLFDSPIIEEEDIEDLLISPKSSLEPYLLSLLIVLIFGLYELYIFLVRKPVLDSTMQLGPPMQQELLLDKPSWPLFSSETYESAFIGFRTREVGESNELDVLKTVKKTLASAGLADFVWKNQEQAPQYLFLIEEQSYEDELAWYFREWVWKLNERDISAEYFFYGRDLHEVWKERAQVDTYVNFTRITAEYNNYRLIIIGSGKVLLNSFEAGLGLNSSLISSWIHRAFLSTRATEDWNWEEAMIEELLPIFPSNEMGFEALTAHWGKDNTTNFGIWKNKALEAGPPEEVDEYIIEELKNYLGKYGFQWLCCCAVYQELYWELTLRFGELVKEYFPQPQIDLPLERILKLPWFRKGRIPRELRLLLYNELDPGLAKSVRKEIIHILSKPQNKASKTSYARQQQETTLAIYSYLNSDKDSQNLENLKNQLLEVSPHSIRDVISIQSIANLSNNPLKIVLPRSFFRGGIKLYGSKWKFRLGLLLTTLLGFWAIYLGFYNRLDEIPGEEPFERKYFELVDNIDSARYDVYKGYYSYQEDNTVDAINLFEAAILKDSTYEKAILNLAKVKFDEAKNLYDQEYYVEAYDGFDSCCNESLIQEAIYAKALSRLYAPSQNELPSVDTTLQLLISLEKRWYSDLEFSESLFINESRDSSVSRLFDRLKLVVENDPNGELLSEVDTLISWIGKELMSLEELLAIANTLLEEGMYEDAIQAYQEILDTRKDLNPGQVAEVKRQIDLIKQKNNNLNSLTTRDQKKEQADNLYKAQVWGAAKLLYEELAEENFPEHIQALFRARIDTCDIRLAEIQRTELYKTYTFVVKTDISNLEIEGLEIRVDAIKSFVTEEQKTFTLERSGIFQMEMLNRIEELEIFLMNLSGEYRVDYYGNSFLRLPEGDTILVSIIRDEFISVDLDLQPGFNPQITMPFTQTEMAGIPTGTFEMGNNEIGRKLHKPQHKVTVAGFFMDKYEVNNQQFIAFLNANGNQVEGEQNSSWLDLEKSRQIVFDGQKYEVKKGYENHPVAYVSWYGARAYANWLSKKTGRKYRLPTEAEWEYAARIGNPSPEFDDYGGSNKIKDVAWYKGNANKTTHPIGQKKANNYGIYDLSGNVAEWCADGYAKYSNKAQNNPKGSASSRTRIYRGGSWNDSEDKCKVYARDSRGPSNRHSFIGFRLVSVD